MAQSNYNIPNAGAPAVRTQLNDVFASIATNNSGATAPSTTFAYQWWYDTTANILKMRNAANSGWINIGTFDQTGGTFMPSGVVNLSQVQVENAASTVFGLVSGERLSQAAAAFSGGVAATGTFTTASEVDIALPAGWFDADIIVRVTACANSDTALDARFTRDAFSSVLSGASDYRWGAATLVYAAVAGTGFNSAGDNKMRLNPQGSSAGMSTAPLAEFRLSVPAYASAGSRKRVSAGGSFLNGVGNLVSLYGSDGVLTAADPNAAINGIRLFPSSGTITGSWALLLRGRL